jgi:hypothetical protein
MLGHASADAWRRAHADGQALREQGALERALFRFGMSKELRRRFLLATSADGTGIREPRLALNARDGT